MAEDIAAPDALDTTISAIEMRTAMVRGVHLQNEPQATGTRPPGPGGVHQNLAPRWWIIKPPDGALLGEAPVTPDMSVAAGSLEPVSGLQACN